jgi:hypothetical protein
VLDPKLLERPPHLGEPILVDLLARLRSEEVVTAAIGIEARWKALVGEHLEQRPQRRARALLLDQERRINLAAGIVQGHDQVELGLPAKPSKRLASWCSIIPTQGFRGRLRRCAPRRFARSTNPAAWSCVLVQV